MNAQLFLFFISLSAIFYIYFGYPVILKLLLFFKKQVPTKDYTYPKVSIIMVAFNEEKQIQKKIENLLNLSYKGEKEILIGSDGSSDQTNKLLDIYSNQKNIKTFINTLQAGKISVINQIIKEATGEIIFFCDVRQEIDNKALEEIVANFSDKSVGAVSGELLFYNSEKTNTSQGVGLYWYYEKIIRKMESDLESMIGATGAIYAIRKNLFIKPDNDIILDDVFIPMKIVEQGYRVIFDKDAIAYDKISLKVQKEFSRKVRTLAGNFQLFFKNPEFYNFKKNKIAWQFFSHKVLRAFAFIFLLTLLISNLFLEQNIYKIFLLLQTAFYFSAFAGFILDKLNIKIKYISFPFIFVSLNSAAFMGFIMFIMNKQKVTWKKN